MIHFYMCKLCGNIIEKIEDSGMIPTCCGREMVELVPGTSDGAEEKHVPAYTMQKICCKDDSYPSYVLHVQIGDKLHPMEKDHHINWIVLETDRGVYRKCLEGCESPHANFIIRTCEKPIAIYEYCNIHGLWMKDLKELDKLEVHS